MVSHMSLLAAENRGLKFQLENNLKDVEKRVEALEQGERLVDSCFFNGCLHFTSDFHGRNTLGGQGQCIMYLILTRVLPNHFTVILVATSSDLGVVHWKMKSWIGRICLSYEFIGSEFKANPKYTIFVTTSIHDLESGTLHMHKKLKVTNLGSESIKLHRLSIGRCFKKDKDNMEICVQCIVVMNSE